MRARVGVCLREPVSELVNELVSVSEVDAVS